MNQNLAQNYRREHGEWGNRTTRTVTKIWRGSNDITSLKLLKKIFQLLKIWDNKCIWRSASTPWQQTSFVHIVVFDGTSEVKSRVCGWLSQYQLRIVWSVYVRNVIRILFLKHYNTMTMTSDLRLHSAKVTLHERILTYLFLYVTCFMRESLRCHFSSSYHCYCIVLSLHCESVSDYHIYWNVEFYSHIVSLVVLVVQRFGQCSRIRILRFFQISKKHDFLRYFEMTFQKNVKSHKKY